MRKLVLASLLLMGLSVIAEVHSIIFATPYIGIGAYPYYVGYYGYPYYGGYGYSPFYAGYYGFAGGWGWPGRWHGGWRGGWRGGWHGGGWHGGRHWR